MRANWTAWCRQKPLGVCRGYCQLPNGSSCRAWATFLPSFLFIFLGAPYVEVIRGNPSLGAALSGVTAAVVGVVLNLALVFGAAVIWPAGLAAEPSWFGVLLSAGAFALLYRYKVDVLWVVLAGGAVGLVGRLLFGG